jgi:hypothetical protein
MIVDASKKGRDCQNYIVIDVNTDKPIRDVFYADDEKNVYKYYGSDRLGSIRIKTDKKIKIVGLPELERYTKKYKNYKKWQAP